MTEFVMDERIVKEAAEIGVTLAHMMAMQLDMMELGALLVKIGQDHEEMLDEWAENKGEITCELDLIVQRDYKFVMADMQRLGNLIMDNYKIHVVHPDYLRWAEQLKQG